MESISNDESSLPLHFLRRNYGAVIVVLSYLVWRRLALEVSRATPILQLVAQKKHEWKFQNIFISLLHSTLTGVSGVVCFFLDPAMAKDLINRYQERCYFLTAISLGYFIHDFIDLYRNSTKSGWELMLHHLIVISCFGSALATRQYLGYAMVAFLIEINSIFLHLRTLLQVCGVSKFSLAYRCNSLFNFGTFIVNRIILLSWMTRWIVINRDVVPMLMYTLGSVSLGILTLMNIVLLYRILRADQMILFSTSLGKAESIGDAPQPKPKDA